MPTINQAAGPSELHKQAAFQTFDAVPAPQSNPAQNEMAEPHEEKQNDFDENDDDDDDVEMQDE